MHAVPQTPEFVQEAAKKCSTSLNRLDELKGVQRGVPVAPEGRFCANTQTTHSCYVYIVSVTCSNIFLNISLNNIDNQMQNMHV